MFTTCNDNLFRFICLDLIKKFKMTLSEIKSIIEPLLNKHDVLKA